MSSGSETFGIISGVFGILAVFSFVGGLLPRSQMRELKSQLEETRDLLDNSMEAGTLGAMDVRFWQERLTKLERDYQSLDVTFSRYPLIRVMPILGPWWKYHVIWALILTVDKTQKELMSKLLSTTSQENCPKAYGPHRAAPVSAVPITSYNSSDDPGGTYTIRKFARPFRSSRDILSVIGLALKVRKALGESTGSSCRYQAFLMELDILCDNLHRTYDNLTSEPQRRSSTRGREIQCTLNSSRLLLHEVDTRITRYRRLLGKGCAHSRMQDSWRKIGWGLFKNEELRLIQERFIEATKRINTLMYRSRCYGPGRMPDEHHLALAQTTQRLEGLPRALGYPWESAAPGRNQTILFNDMLGQNIYLPIELCTNPEIFEGLLTLYFHDRAGRFFVDRGDYELTSVGNDSSLVPLDLTNWRNIVKPGSTVDMTAIVRRTPQDDDTLHCPSCAHTAHGLTFQGQAGNKCLYCGAWFTVSQANSEDITARQSRRLGNRPSTTSRLIGPELTVPSDWREPDDIRFLRRIRIILEKRHNGACKPCQATAHIDCRNQLRQSEYTGQDLSSVGRSEGTSQPNPNGQDAQMLYMGGDGISRYTSRDTTASHSEHANTSLGSPMDLYVSASMPSDLGIRGVSILSAIKNLINYDKTLHFWKGGIFQGHYCSERPNVNATLVTPGHPEEDSLRARMDWLDYMEERMWSAE